MLDKPSVEAMAKVCEQYKFTEVPSDDNDSRTFKHDDGTLIKFNIISDSTGCENPYVEIHTTESKKSIEKSILNAGFRKEKNNYTKGYHGARRFTECLIIGNTNRRVIFTKENGINY